MHNPGGAGKRRESMCLVRAILPRQTAAIPGGWLVVGADDFIGPCVSDVSLAFVDKPFITLATEEDSLSADALPEKFFFPFVAR